MIPYDARPDGALLLRRATLGVGAMQRLPPASGPRRSRAPLASDPPGSGPTRIARRRRRAARVRSPHHEGAPAAHTERWQMAEYGRRGAAYRAFAISGRTDEDADPGRRPRHAALTECGDRPNPHHDAASRPHREMANGWNGVDTERAYRAFAISSRESAGSVANRESAGRVPRRTDRSLPQLGWVLRWPTEPPPQAPR